jgi:DNA polymerase III delta prime subunit
MQRASGEISQAEHDRGVAKVKAERAALAEALSLSKADMRRAARNLQTAAKRGQSGLDWHIRTANQLADDVASQRSSISLL